MSTMHNIFAITKNKPPNQFSAFYKVFLSFIVRILMQKHVTEESMPSWKNLSTMFDTIYNSCAAGKLAVNCLYTLLCYI